MEKSRQNNQKWVKTRHKVITAMAVGLFWLFLLFKCGIAVKKYSDRKRQCLVLMNHQTSLDQFFVGVTFFRPMYYVASEDIFSNGLVSKLLKFSVNPIPINKSAADMRAIINCIKVAKEGGSIVIAPEGNRTYSGRTCYIKPSIVPLIRKLNLPIVFFKIEGGYGMQPRWTDKNRRGPLKFGVTKVTEPETYAGMSDDELYSLIVNELSVNEDSVCGCYKSKKSAEYIERMLYVCPDCGLTEYKSKGEYFYCTGCNKRYRYSPTKEIIPESGEQKFRFAADFYAFQEDFVRNLSITRFIDTPAYCENIRLFSVELYKRKKILSKNTVLKLYSDRIELNDENKGIALKYGFDGIKSISLLGRNKMNVRTQDGIYQIRGTKSFNAVKYLNFYSHYKAKTGGASVVNGNTEFLGL